MSDHTIPLAECVRGHAYRVNSRNLVVGVFDGDTGFIGIREKLGEEYLFTEFHYAIGPPFGTARPFEDLGPCPIEDLAGKPLLEWLKAKEREVAIPCRHCGKPYFPVPWDDNGFCLRRACWMQAEQSQPRER